MAEIFEPNISVRFGGNSKTQKIPPIYQYDHGRKLLIYGLDLSRKMTVQYSYFGLSEAMTIEGTKKDDYLEVMIPDAIQMQEQQIVAYIYVEEDNSGITVFELSIPIIPRPRPTDMYTPEQIDNYNDAVLELGQSMAQVEELSETVSALKEEVAQASSEATKAAAEASKAAEDASQAVTKAEDAIESLTLDWESIQNKPDEFPPSAHNHNIEDVQDLQSMLDSAGKIKTVNNKEPDDSGNVLLDATDVKARPDTWVPEIDDIEGLAEALENSGSESAVSSVNGETGDVIVTKVSSTNGRYVGEIRNFNNAMGVTVNDTRYENAAAMFYFSTGDNTVPKAVYFSSETAGKIHELYSNINPPPYPVSSVNEKTGEIVLSASDVGAAEEAHSHEEYALSDHEHDGYASTDHTHLYSDVGAAAEQHAHSLNDMDDTLSVEKGGTGSTTAADARTALEITPENIGAVPESKVDQDLKTTSDVTFKSITAEVIYGAVFME